MSAKFYIYRNLHTKTFSVRYRGKVIAHPKQFTAYGVEFKVNETGRQNVLSSQRKQVHAFVVCDRWTPRVKNAKIISRVFYDPYENNSFVGIKNNSIKSTPMALGAFGKMIFTGERV